MGEGTTQYRGGREAGMRAVYKDLRVESIGFKEEFYLKGRWRTYLIEDVRVPGPPLTLRVPNVVGRFENGMTRAVMNLWREGYYTVDLILWTGFPPRADGGWVIQGGRRPELENEKEARRQVEHARRENHDVLLRELEDLRARGIHSSSEKNRKEIRELQRPLAVASERDRRAQYAVKLYTSGRCGENDLGESTWIRNTGAIDVSATIVIEVSGDSWQEIDRGTTTVRVPANRSVRVGCTLPVWRKVYSYRIVSAGFLR